MDGSKSLHVLKFWSSPKCSRRLFKFERCFGGSLGGDTCIAVEIVSPLSGWNHHHFYLNFEFDSYRVKMVEVVEVYSSYDDCCGTCSHNVTRFNIKSMLWFSVVISL
jgi:hypothetical protein